LSVIAALGGCRDHKAEKRVAKQEMSRGAEARDAALTRARVWAPPHIDPARADFGINPAGPGAFAADADVECVFSVEPVGGSTPKFMCTLPDGGRIKVKYGVPNGELPAEIAATRLLGALGFPTDRMNKVHSVRCHGCPPLPQQALQCLARNQPAAACLQGASGSSIVTFEPAAIEAPMAGRKIEVVDDQGWSWYELDRIDPKAGGSSRAEVDALRLLAIVLAHWDNKGANQKLLCPSGADRADGTCSSPIAAIGDLGGTFGPKKVDLQNWKHVAVWVDPRACLVSMKTMPFAGATFPDRRISEEGRRFALKLLGALSSTQLDTLFAASGMAAFPHVLAEARQPHSWTAAFLDKVNQIEHGGPCPD
jgi:hypothetical protein